MKVNQRDGLKRKEKKRGEERRGEERRGEGATEPERGRDGGRKEGGGREEEGYTARYRIAAYAKIVWFLYKDKTKPDDQEMERRGEKREEKREGKKNEERRRGPNMVNATDDDAF